MSGVASFVRGLDPRLKMAIALVLGPCLWKIHILAVACCVLFLLSVVWPLSMSQPVGGKMIRSLLFFVLFWVGIKAVLDGFTGVPSDMLLLDAVELAGRLTGLLLLGLTLALSTSSRALGLAVAWAVRPFIGQERAWRIALALALMVHFLPTCLTTMTQTRDVVSRRCPGFGFKEKMQVIPQTVIRTLGQKTWNQTLAVASRGLDVPEAWQPLFSWASRDTVVLLIAVLAIAAAIAA